MASKESYQKNKAKVKARSKAYYEANKEAIKLRSRNNYELNKDSNRIVNRERSRKYYHNNKEKVAEYNRVLWLKLRAEVLEAAGGATCIRCGFDDLRALQVDHINGGGRREIQDNPTYKNPRVYAEVIRKNPEKYQVLCANCNWIKRFENNELKKNS